MANAPSLRELQHELETLFSLGGSPGYARRLEAATDQLPIGGDERLPPADRLGIYTQMIFVRIRDAIAEDFQATQTALGEADWDDLIARYLQAHPTTHPDLRLAPRHLPAFLRKNGPPGLADLADLEWALMESFTSADATILQASTLQSLPTEAWPEVLLRAIPSLRILTPSSDADRNRRQLLDGDSPELRPTTPFGLRLWRRELRVFQKRVDEPELGALMLIQNGISFADLCAWLEDHQDDEPSEAAVRLLQTWLADELLIDTTHQN